MKKVSITKLNKSAIVPTRGSMKAAGYDLYTTEFHILKPGERRLFKTGLSMAIPSGMYGRIAPRSGLALKNGIDVLAGVIDEDYRGEIGVVLINLGQEDKNITVGDKIAQIIFEFYNEVDFSEESALNETSRGSGGYGSTDKPVEDTAFVLRNPTTVEKAFAGSNRAKIDMAKAYFANFQGEAYIYTENGYKGICVVDSSGTVLHKTPLEKLS
jgi:dUTP pyrophosphatase